MVQHPHALLLDFGGVIVDAPSQPPAPDGLVRRLHDLTAGAVSLDRAAADLAEGNRRYAAWRDRTAGQDRPAEVSHTQFWDDFVTVGWPTLARAAVRREATALAYQWTRRSDWAVIAGMARLLTVAADAGLPVAIVSNTLCGGAHRDFLTEVGLAGHFAAQLYSDEAGVRKPNPELAWQAANAIGVPIGQCWFIGDTVDRDVACARRAGAGTAVLMRSPRTDRQPPVADLAPDLTVDNGHACCALLERTLDDVTD